MAHNINGGCAEDNFEFHQTIDTENGKYLFNEHSTETKCVTCGKKGYYDCSNHNCEEGNDGVLDKVKKTSRKKKAKKEITNIACSLVNNIKSVSSSASLKLESVVFFFFFSLQTRPIT